MQTIIDKLLARGIKKFYIGNQTYEIIDWNTRESLGNDGKRRVTVTLNYEILDPPKMEIVIKL